MMLVLWLIVSIGEPSLVRIPPKMLENSPKMIHKDSTPSNYFPDTKHGILSIKTVKAKLIQIYVSTPLKTATR